MKRAISFVLFLFLVFALNGQSGADYSLAVDDQMEITVWGHPDLSKSLIIDPDGRISLPLIGEIQAGGLTIRDLTQNIEEKLSKYIKEPRVSVSLRDYQREEIMVMGKVQNPGTFKLPAGGGVLDALSFAGGPLDSADLEGVVISRDDAAIEVNVENLLQANNPREKIYLQPGDVVYVPDRFFEVTILGEVRSPGRYRVESGLRMSDLLAKAGGPLDSASPRVNLDSGDNMHSVYLDDILEGTKNPELQAGDSVYIGSTRYEVTILGEINQPGSYRVEEEMRLSELLARAGGVTEKARREKGTLVRGDEEFSFHLGRVLQGEGGDEDYTLQRGDQIFIGEATYQVLILGEVRRPGAYPWRENMRIAELLVEAGSYEDRGDISEIAVLRDEDEMITVDLGKYFYGQAREENIPLQPGDVVVVREVGTFDWEQLFFFIGGLKTIKDFLGISW